MLNNIFDRDKLIRPLAIFRTQTSYKLYINKYLSTKILIRERDTLCMQWGDNNEGVLGG